MSNRHSLLETKYRHLIKLYNQSGKSVQEFCLEHRISSWTFYTWRKRLRCVNMQQVTKRALTVPLFSPVTLNTTSAYSAPTDHVEILLPDGILLRIPCHASVEIIKETIGYMRGRL
jgi:transposase-like protein